MNSEPLVSVIMATYNREEFIEQAIDSVLTQSYEHLELIVIDDGSTDNTKALLESKYNDNRLIYHYQDNTGQSIARNVALGMAKGEYIAFIDSDNAWTDGKLKKQVEYFQAHDETDIIYGDIITIDEHNNEVTRDNMKRYSGYIADILVKDNFVSNNTALAKKKCFDELGGMSGKVKVADDYELWLRFSSKYHFTYLPEFFALYRVMANQISSDKTRRFDCTEVILTNFFNEFPNAVNHATKNRGWAHFYLRKFRYLLSVNNKKDSLNCLIKAFKNSPSYWPIYRAFAKYLVSFAR